MSEVIRIAISPSLFGFGALSKLPDELRARNFRRILIITDPQISADGILDRVLTLLKGSFEIERFEKVPAEPHSTDVDRQKERFQSDFDALLAIGGGSCMDFAKALSILMAHGGSLGDYVGEGLVPGPVLPVVCVPTTSGTGSQNTQTTVFTVGGVKMGCSSEFIRPVFSVVDPELTMKLPTAVTRNAGYDALMHAVEGFIACPHERVPDRPILYQGSNPFSRGLALEAFQFIWRSYLRSVRDGQDREARYGMSIGSHLAGIAFSHSGLGLVHALASSLGGMIDAPHGVCLAACTNIGLRYNFETCHKDLAMLATAIQKGKGQTSAEQFLEKMDALIRDLKLPSRPSDLGIRKGDAQILLQKTLIQTRRIQTNPRHLDEDLFSFIEAGI
jgi:alcohol dehydrogenase class IV